MKATITAVDFGTSKVVTLISTPRESNINNCDVIGVGVAKYDGYINGQWIAPEELPTIIQQSISEAQKQAGGRTKVNEVYVGVPGEFSEIRVFNVKLEIQGADPRVKKEHIDEIFRIADEHFNNAAAREADPSNDMVKNLVVHRSPAWFIIDGEKKTLEPLGLKGREISAMVCFVTTNSVFTKHMTYLFNQMNIKVVGFYSSLMGQVNLYIPEAELDKVAVLVDVGYLGTDLVICEGDAIVYQDRIPIGGGHISVALASGLGVPMNSQLEELKRRYQFAMLADIPTEYKVQAADSSHVDVYTQEELDALVHPVVNELCENIMESIEASGCSISAENKLYLTGGGLVKNKGAKEYMQSKLGRSVTELPNVTINMTEPYFSSAMGLMMIIVADGKQSAEDKGVGGFFKRLFSM